MHTDETGSRPLKNKGANRWVHRYTLGRLATKNLKVQYVVSAVIIQKDIYTYNNCVILQT